MKFTKMQGAGNDFVVIETSDTQRDWSAMAIAACDRHYGAGADGLLLMMPSSLADFRMRIFNADGSEASACGNGLRCLVKHFADNGAKDKAPEISVETAAGVRRVAIYREAGGVAKIQTGMGKPRFGEKDIPVIIGKGRGNLVNIKTMMNYTLGAGSRRLSLNLVSMGNPHAVYFYHRPVAGFPLSRIGPKVENHQIFPRGVNFEVARVLGRQQIEGRVWEEGVGETLACGSGACAMVAAARLHGYVDSRVEVMLPGGTLEVEWDGVGEVLLGGPAETVFSGEWPEDKLPLKTAPPRTKGLYVTGKTN